MRSRTALVPEPVLEGLQLMLRPGRQGFNIPGIQITDIASETKPACLMFSEISKSDALYAPFNQKVFFEHTALGFERLSAKESVILPKSTA
jgi:hypothetical protein